MVEIIRILDAIDQHDAHSAHVLLPEIYGELRRLAAQKLAREKPGQTLEPTALVHEAYLRLTRLKGQTLGQSGAFLRGRRGGHAANSGGKCPPQTTVSARGRSDSRGFGRVAIGGRSAVRHLVITRRRLGQVGRGRPDARPNWSSCVSTPDSQCRRSPTCLAFHSERPSGAGPMRGLGCTPRSVSRPLPIAELHKILSHIRCKFSQAGRSRVETCDRQSEPCARCGSAQTSIPLRVSTPLRGGIPRKTSHC